MFDIGFWELIILAGLGLVILGPERLPRVAIKLGNWAGQARRMARTLSTQMRSELDLNQTIGAYEPPRAKSWQRPGVDDLKPAESASGDADGDDTRSEPAHDTSPRSSAD